MGNLKTIKAKPFPFLSRPLSIRQQLPLLICLLLLVLITLFGTISYLGIRRAESGAGQQRLRSLTAQLASLFHQSARTMVTMTQATANREEIVNFLSADTQRSQFPARALEVLQKVLVDSQTSWMELRDLQGRLVLRAGREAGMTKGQEASPETNPRTKGPDPSKEITGRKPDTNFIGKIYTAGDSMYYPIVVAVLKDKRPVGYLLRWRPMRATPQSLAQLSQLMGAKATLYFGNNDGTLWTDMLRPVAAPPSDLTNIHQPVTYKRPGGSPVIAFSLPVAGSKWIILVELSRDLILETSNRFLYWMIAIGAILMITGMFVAWRISRNITRPLDRLIAATAAIASGDYSSPVAVDRTDELGKLAASFNSMAVQVHHAQDGLEKRVQARTQELEAVNKELEAFSYSVSHDLRAPLRAVSGYAIMLKEDYEDSLDAEAQRITGNIISNVKMMGRLIDDLIAFSRLGKREIVRREVDMKPLAEACVTELLHAWPEEKFSIVTGDLPKCGGDEDLIKQIWMNLIGNALKYSAKKEEPLIEIGSAKDAAGTTYFVRDNGAGFEMKYADKLFKVFQRLHSQEEFEGTGVGLALVKRIIDKHKGRIWAESAPGNGAAFFFSLPA
jgi:signal transduction histidine kinase